MRARVAPRTVAFAVAALLAASACHRHVDSAAQAAAAQANIARLASPDAGARRDAAKELTSSGPPPESVGPLLAAAKQETVARALQAELVALGATGAPEAESILETHATEDLDKDTRRAAQKALKTWRTKNGQVVRRDVETQTVAASPSASPVDRAGDACAQFSQICGADPFAVDRCKADLAPLDKPKLEAWADCVNASSLSCQKAHDACVLKVKKAP
ncbi:MAG TPA: HEAT repeat domain-containing protein [Minicystis sp.]|nr:HEAT repeat domain-containing protein [Minicystis sp.]